MFQFNIVVRATPSLQYWRRFKLIQHKPRVSASIYIHIDIDGAVVEQVKSFKFLNIHITKELSWSKHTNTVVKRAQQRLFPLRRLKRFGMGPQILKKLYSCTIESILTGYITTWYGNCLASDRKALQSVLRTAQYNSSHPFSLLPHGKRYWCLVNYSTICIETFCTNSIDSSHMLLLLFYLSFWLVTLSLPICT